MLLAISYRSCGPLAKFSTSQQAWRSRHLVTTPRRPTRVTRLLERLHRTFVYCHLDQILCFKTSDEFCCRPARMLRFKRKRAKTVEPDVDLNTRSPLFRIPAELRECIWEYTLTYPSSSDSLHFHVYDEVRLRISFMECADMYSRYLTNARTKHAP